MESIKKYINGFIVSVNGINQKNKNGQNVNLCLLMESIKK